MRDDDMVFVWILIGSIITIIGVFVLPNILIWNKKSHTNKVNKKALKYFKTKEFITLRDKILNDVIEFNNFNLYLGELKCRLPNIGSNEVSVKKILTKDVSKKHIINCNYETLQKAKEQPFDTICDQFNIKISNITFKKLEELYNMYMSIEMGHKLLKEKRAYIISKITSQLPEYAKEDINLLYDKLHFDYIDDDNYYPHYIFKCKNQQIDIIFNTDNLIKFINYLATQLQVTPVMNKEFRSNILKRDGFTCSYCKATNLIDVTLLFELIPKKSITLGGNIEPNNYETICWKCSKERVNNSTNTIKLNPIKPVIKFNIKKKKKNRIRLKL